MNQASRLLSIMLVLLPATFAAAVQAQPQADPSAGLGAVYTATNGVDGNQVVAYRRAADGTLTYLRTYPTGGRGSGGTVDPLQSQHSVLLSDDDRWLFVVNSGTGDVSSFAVHPGGGLTLVDREPTHGGFPNALALRGRFLYVLNAGGAGSASGFHVSTDGTLVPIADSTQFLSATSAGGSSIAISPDGTALVATERLTGLIDVFPIGSDGVLGAPVLSKSNGAVPFADSFTPQGALVVCEAGGGPAGTGALSTYTLDSDDTLSVITGSLGTGFSTTCWVITSPDGDFAFASNPGSSEITTDSISDDGSLTNSSAVASTGAAPLDIALTGNGRYLYALTIGSGTISEFQVTPDGALTAIGSVGSRPAASGQNGIAAF